MNTINKIKNVVILKSIFSSEYFSVEEKVKALNKIILLSDKNDKGYKDFLWNLAVDSIGFSITAKNELLKIGNLSDLLYLVKKLKMPEALSKLLNEHKNSQETKDALSFSRISEGEIRTIAFHEEHKNDDLSALLEFLPVKKNKQGIIKILCERHLKQDERYVIKSELSKFYEKRDGIYEESEFYDLYYHMGELEDLFKLFCNKYKSEEILDILLNSENGRKLLINNKSSLLATIKEQTEHIAKVAAFLANEKQIESLALEKHLTAFTLNKLIEELNIEA